jgi:hypothetical protein
MTQDTRGLSAEELAIERGRESWRKLAKDENWQDWLNVGDALAVCRGQAMRAANTNQPIGRAYNEAMGLLLKKHGFDRIDKGDRSRLMECMDRRAEINVWRDTLSVTERIRLNHPSAVLRKWKAATKVNDKAGAGSPRLALQDQVIRLQEENDMLRARQASGFMPGTSAEAAAERIAEHHNPRFLRQLASKLNEVADREERQNRIEAGARRKRGEAAA